MNITNKIKSLATRHKKIIENFSYLSILQIFNILLPLISYPYLIRVLGAELYGTVIFAQTIIAYCSIVLNFGFEACATKEISMHRGDSKKISEIVSSAYIIKVVLFIALFLILIFTINLFPHFKEYKLLYIFSYMITFNELLFPIWYFQGMEKMKYITIINVFVRSLFVILIFVFIKTAEDYIYVPLFNGIGALIGGLLAIYIVFVKDKVNFIKQSSKTLFFHLKENLPVFSSNLIISIKDRFNVILIGSFLGMQEVAIYDLGIKVMKFFMQPITVANNAIYPKVAREQDMTFVKKFIKISFIIVLSAIIIIQPFLSYIVNYLSNNLEGAVNISRILLISPIIFIISLTLARNCILALGKYKYIFIGVIYTSLFYLLLIGLGYSLNLLKSVYIFAAITVLTYLFELFYRLYACKKINAFR